MLIHNAEVTGSLRINNVPFNSGSFSGSFRGDGSQLTGVTGATTASYVEYSNVGNKPALVSGSSQITYSGLSGIPSGIVSGSSQVTYSGLTGIPEGIVSSSAQITGFGIFATTGSNQFNGSQVVTGSLTVTGQVVAQTLNVQQVTSSIVYSSGSNIFGNSLANTQQFTGSVSVTGSLTVNGIATSGTVSGTTNYISKFTGTNTIGNSTITDNGTTVSVLNSAYTDVLRVGSTSNSIYFYPDGGSVNIMTGTGFSGTGITFASGSNYLDFNTNSLTRMRITSGGFVGIGTTPSTFLHVLGSNTSARGQLSIQSNNASNGAKATWYYDTTLQGEIGTTSGDFYALAVNNFLFYAGGAERMLITSSGNVGIGTTSPSSRLNIAGAKTNSVDLTNAANQLAVTDTTATAAGVGGRISFLGSYTSTPDYITFGAIEVLKDNANNYGSASWNNAAMRFIVGNNDNDANAGRMLERMRITSGGNIGISTNSPLGSSAERTIHLSDGGGGYATVYVTNSANTVRSIFGMQSAQNLVVVGSQTNTPVAIYTNDTERMRITSGGNVGINTASPNTRLTIAAATAGSSGFTDYFKIGSDASNGSFVGTGGYPSLVIGTFGVYDASIASFGNDLRIYSGRGVSTEDHQIMFYTGFNGAGGAAENNERMRITHNGYIRMASGTGGIQFNGDTAAANALDDYEEGNWTPVLRGSTTSGSYTYDTDRTAGQYVKIGKKVYVQGVYRIASVISAGSGNALIGGLPFAPSGIDISWDRIPGILHVQSGPTLPNESIFVYTQGNTYTDAIGIGFDEITGWNQLDVTTADHVEAMWWFSISYLV